MERIAKWWALDLRSLAFVRISYGLILLCDILIRSTDLFAHYTDFGLAPRNAVMEFGDGPGFISFHMMNGTWFFEAFLFSIGALAAISLTVGYRTFLSGLIVWIHLISMQNRNPVVLDGGDIYIRTVMFWLLFLPWGARWSVDALRRRQEENPQPATVFNAATICYTLQICLVYWCAAMLKTGVEWRVTHTATYYALMVKQLTTPFAKYLLRYPELLKQLTASVLIFEGFGPCLLWMPGPLRLLGVLGIAALHLGFGAFMHLAIFVPIGVCSPMGLLPGFVWDYVERLRLFQWIAAKATRWSARWPYPGAGEVRVKPMPFWVTLVLVFLMIEVIIWNGTDMPGHNLPLNRPTAALQPFRLDQKWNMFAPKPLDEDGWYVIEAHQVNGHTVDLFRDGAPVTWDEPRRIAPMYPNARWRKFMMNIWAKDLADWRLFYGRYLTRRWNGSHRGGEQISTFTIYFMLQRTLATGGYAPTEKVSIWQHKCFETAATPGTPPVPSATPPAIKATPVAPR